MKQFLTELGKVFLH